MASPTHITAGGVRRPNRSRPRPGGTLLASAQRMTSQRLQRGVGKSETWQADAWDMYDLVGEHRFLAQMLANRLSQAQLYIGRMPENPTEDPVPVENEPQVTAVLDSIGASQNARAQLVQRLGVNLFVTGDGWLAGIPRHLVPPDLMTGPISAPVVDPELIPLPAEGDDRVDISALDWRMLSVSEVSATGSEVTLKLGETAQQHLIVSPDQIVLIRVWRSHPRFWWQADSPTRSTLPVLRELVGLTMRSSAEIDSRLAGAGLLVVPEGAQRALSVAADLDEDAGDQDVFTEALMEAMMRPIEDRSSASAVVPLVVTVPDELTDKFQYLNFSAPLDERQAERIDQSIRRLALGLDAPPELLLGTSGMNHWGAWLVLEDVVATHLEPPLALICDAITSQFLWPVLVDQGMTPEQAQSYVCWYDVSDLVVRPTRSTDAQAMHAAGVISDSALREANGFEEADAPEVDRDQQNPPEVTMALDMVRAAPGLMTTPGLPQLVAQIRAVLAGEIPELIDPMAAAAGGGATNSTSVNGNPNTAGQNPGAAGTADTGPAIRMAPPIGPQGAKLPGAGLAASVTHSRTPVDLTIDPRYLFAAGDGQTRPIEAPRDLDSADRDPSEPTVAGLAVLATDTGRVLMIQRSFVDETDPARGTWEFPGGHIEQGEEPFDAAVREFTEETGIVPGDLPLVVAPSGPGWTSSNGVYVGYVVEVPTETDIVINPGPDDRSTPNPDDPDGDDIETVAWFDPDHLEGMPALRSELAADLQLVLQALGADPIGSEDEEGELVDLTAGALAPSVLWSVDPIQRWLSQFMTKPKDGEKGKGKPKKDEKKKEDEPKSSESSGDQPRDEIGRWAPAGGGGGGGSAEGDQDLKELDKEILELQKQIKELELQIEAESGGGGGSGSSGGGSGEKDEKGKDGGKADEKEKGKDPKAAAAAQEKIDDLNGKIKAEKDPAKKKALIERRNDAIGDKAVAEGRKSIYDDKKGKPQDGKKDGKFDPKAAAKLEEAKKQLADRKEKKQKAQAAKKSAEAKDKIGEAKKAVAEKNKPGNVISAPATPRTRGAVVASAGDIPTANPAARMVEVELAEQPAAETAPEPVPAPADLSYPLAARWAQIRNGGGQW